MLPTMRRETAPKMIVQLDVRLVRNAGFPFDAYMHEYAYLVLISSFGRTGFLRFENAGDCSFWTSRNGTVCSGSLDLDRG
jgi:hypothetical protein